MHSAFPVGMVVATSKRVLGNLPGARAVVYEQYRISAQHYGVSLLFQNGAYDGFCEWSVDACEINPVRLDPVCAAYRFDNVSKLVEDFHRGVFSSAFRDTS